MNTQDEKKDEHAGDDDHGCLLTVAQSRDPEFLKDANSVAVGIARMMLDHGARHCGHVTLGLLGVAASAAAFEPELTEDQWIDMARGLYRFNKIHREDPNMVVDPSADAVHVPAGATQH